MIETDLLKLFMYRAARELPTVRLFRRNIVNAKTQAGWHAKAGIKGQCDLYAYVRGGFVVEIETKARRGRLSEEQETWRDWCKAWGFQWIELREQKGETSDQTVGRWIRELRFAIPLL